MPMSSLTCDRCFFARQQIYKDLGKAHMSGSSKKRWRFNGLMSCCLHTYPIWKGPSRVERAFVGLLWWGR